MSYEGRLYLGHRIRDKRALRKHTPFCPWSELNYTNTPRDRHPSHTEGNTSRRDGIVGRPTEDLGSSRNKASVLKEKKKLPFAPPAPLFPRLYLSMVPLGSAPTFPKEEGSQVCLPPPHTRATSLSTLRSETLGLRTDDPEVYNVSRTRVPPSASVLESL